MKNSFFVLTLIATTAILAKQAHADGCGDGFIACGDDCGTNCRWSISADGKLSIQGTGTDNSGQIGKFKYIKENNTTVNTTAPWGTYITDIRNVEIQNGITNLGSYAFAYIPSQNPIEIPSSVTSISEAAFYRVRTPEVIIPDSVLSIDKQAFDWSFIETVNIPDSVTKIGRNAFRATKQLTNIVIPNSVTEIGAQAFSICKNLQSIVIGDGVTSIGENTFDSTPAYVYCQESGHGGKSCAELVTETGLASDKLKIYTIENGKIKVGSKTYNSLHDVPGYVLRRIYTIKEAEAAAGPVNHVTIRYR